MSDAGETLDRIVDTPEYFEATDARLRVRTNDGNFREGWFESVDPMPDASASAIICRTYTDGRFEVLVRTATCFEEMASYAGLPARSHLNDATIDTYAYHDVSATEFVGHVADVEVVT